MPSILLTAFGLALLGLVIVEIVHVREMRCVRSALGSLLETLRSAPQPPSPARPLARPIESAPIAAPAPPVCAEPELTGDRDSTEALTQVMQNPLSPVGVDLSSVPAQLAAGLARPKSQRTGRLASTPHPPPVKVGPPRTATIVGIAPPAGAPSQRTSRPLPGTLPLVLPPPLPPASPRRETLRSMPAHAPPDKAEKK